MDRIVETLNRMVSEHFPGIAVQGCVAGQCCDGQEDEAVNVYAVPPVFYAVPPETFAEQFSDTK